MRQFHYLRIAALFAVLEIAFPADAVKGQTITYLGVIYDQTDFDRLDIGKSGYWFPQFAATGPVSGRPTGENVRESLPPWAGPLNHTSSVFDPNYATRSFSQDGPARSKGGQSTWNAFKLPNGEVGLSGAIVDPFARNNSNNTINRIQLNSGVLGTFYFHVVTDNTNFAHNPTNRLRARGTAGGSNVDPATFPQTADLHFNGIADVYSYRYDGFVAGDFIKLQLNGDPAPNEGPSFGGFLLDTVFDAHAVVAGDFNQDEGVDAADYITWRKTLGETGINPPADANRDHAVDADDYVIWRAHFGMTVVPGSGSTALASQAVPEPGGLLPFLATWSLCLASCRHRGSQN